LGIAAAALGAAEAEVPVKLADFIVTPSRFGVAEEKAAASATLTSRELETLPQVGDDLYRSISRLPGLAADDFSAQFWVRGAPQREVRGRLDGLDLIEPFHLKDVDGALSLVDPQTISRLELSTGGFGAESGDRLAGVMTMETKTPQAGQTRLSLSLTGVGAMNQGVAEGGKARWLVAARRGYPDIALKVANRDQDVTPRYYDVTGKVEYNLAPGHTLALQALHGGDTLTYSRKNDPSLRSSYDNDYVWARWRAQANPRLSGETVVAGSWLAWSRTGAGLMDGYPFSLRDERNLQVFSARSEWSYAANDEVILRAGAEGAASAARYDYALARAQTVVVAGKQVMQPTMVATRLRPEGDTVGAFVTARALATPTFVVEPGIRFDARKATEDSEVNPRLNVAWTLGGGVLRAAWGLYSQRQGWHELHVADGETRLRRAERAEHKIIGYEHAVGRGVSLRLEAYERTSWRLRPRWENVDNGYDLFPEAQPDRLLIQPKEGRARGVEVLLASRGNRELTWNVSYALARAEERIATGWIRRAREQRHTVYADVTYVPNARWQLSAAWQYHSGWPTTNVEYALATLTTGRRVLVSANGPLYGLSLPDYHRLDLRATRRFTLRRGELRVFIDVFNAYNRTNYVGYIHNVSVSGTTITETRKPRDQLPLLPSAGVAWEF
jgi:hypothetical protein